jgi:hypothetical protein
MLGAASMTPLLQPLRELRRNGWFRDGCLSDAGRPLTHTLGYALRGVIEAFLAAAIRTADGLLTPLHNDRFLAGRLDAAWNGVVDWCFLTGSVQIARCWLMPHPFTRREKYLRAHRAASQFVRRVIRLDTPDGIRGGGELA